MRWIATAMIAGTFVAGPLAAQPTTSPQMFPTEPMVLGQVSEVTSHSVAVNTAKGERMEFEFDSGTLMPTPAQLANETPVKVLFRTLDSGLHLAKRITALEPGSLAYAQLEYELAMTESSRESRMGASDLDREEPASDAPIASNASDANASGHDPNMGQKNAEEARVGAREEAREEASEAAGKDATEHDKDYRNTIRSDREREDELPRTASSQGWLIFVGVGAVLLAIAARFMRRRRTV